MGGTIWVIEGAPPPGESRGPHFITQAPIEVLNLPSPILDALLFFSFPSAERSLLLSLSFFLSLSLSFFSLLRYYSLSSLFLSFRLSSSLSLSLSILLLIDANIFYEIIFFGMNDARDSQRMRWWIIAWISPRYFRSATRTKAPE